MLNQYVCRSVQSIKFILKRSTYSLNHCRLLSIKNNPLDDTCPGSFVEKQIGPNIDEEQEMLQTLGFSNATEFINHVIPFWTTKNKPLEKLISNRILNHVGQSEAAVYEDLQNLAKLNKGKDYRSFIGRGYHNSWMPMAIRRHILENPGWYTSYTPYQAEISQGRLKMLYDYQTMISSLTGLPIANASLLDEGSAAAEAMLMAFRVHGETKGDTQKNLTKPIFWIEASSHQQVIQILEGRAANLNIELKYFSYDGYCDKDIMSCSHSQIELNLDGSFGVYFPYPNTFGTIPNPTELHKFSKEIKNAGMTMIFGSVDLLAMALIRSPGELGADIAVGTSQRFGQALGNGGPHAAFISCTKSLIRKLPGRLVGVAEEQQFYNTSENQPLVIDSKAQTQVIYRLSLQTREQHIRREKATSNICTAQSLPANIAIAYAIYHGPTGLQSIARRIHSLMNMLSVHLQAAFESASLKGKFGFVYNKNGNPSSAINSRFDTIAVKMPRNFAIQWIQCAANKCHINLGYFENVPFSGAFTHDNVTFHQQNGESNVEQEILSIVLIALDETVVFKDLYGIVASLYDTLNIKKNGLLSRLKFDYQSAAFKDQNFSFPQKYDTLGEFLRKDSILVDSVFHRYHSETSFFRYLQSLVSMDYSLLQGMIPLGSCTMKLNPAVSMISSLGQSGWTALHPYAPIQQAKGYTTLIDRLLKILQNLLGFSSGSVQPNSGSTGEMTGLYMIRKYHNEQNLSISQKKSQSLSTASLYEDSASNLDRSICLIPVSAHGTNAATARLCGYTVKTIPCDPLTGKLDLSALLEQLSTYGKQIGILMLTIPSTYGIFDAVLHQQPEPEFNSKKNKLTGGSLRYDSLLTKLNEKLHHLDIKVYMDGANLNALLGWIRPGIFTSISTLKKSSNERQISLQSASSFSNSLLSSLVRPLMVDVMHINLHKTLTIPHGGGGPGIGLVLCSSTLAPYLPASNYFQLLTSTSRSSKKIICNPATKGKPLSIAPVAAAPFGSASLLPIAYAYLRLLGLQGIQRATYMALLNANYARYRLKNLYSIPYKTELLSFKNISNGSVSHAYNLCAHEFIIDCAPISELSGGVLTAFDIAKRLIDYGFHPPTLAWPLKNSLMIEITESEPFYEICRLIDALTCIYYECTELESKTESEFFVRSDDVTIDSDPLLGRKSRQHFDPNVDLSSQSIATTRVFRFHWVLKNSPWTYQGSIQLREGSVADSRSCKEPVLLALFPFQWHHKYGTLPSREKSPQQEKHGKTAPRSIVFPTLASYSKQYAPPIRRIDETNADRKLLSDCLSCV